MMNPINLRNKIKKKAAGKCFLGFLSFIYGMVSDFRKTLYDRGILKSRSVNSKTVCLGNISAGGTGKTSTVILAAKELSKLGFKVAVIIRGYGRKNKKRKVVVLYKGEEFARDEAGDEALLLYTILEDDSVPVIVSSNRYKAAQIAQEKFGSDIILMDDGYQHFGLARDKNILLINSKTDLKKEKLMPLGNLREKTSAIKRADLVILTHTENITSKELDDVKLYIKSRFPKKILAETAHSPKYFLKPSANEKVPLHEIKQSVVALSAIGDPDAFEKNLKSLGIKIAQSWKFADHHYFTRTELVTIAENGKSLPIITTYKDFLRFPEDWRKLFGEEVYILIIDIMFLCDGYKKFMDVLTDEKAVTGNR